MDKFMHFVEDKMSPIADKLGEQRHLSAMQKGFMTVLPLILGQYLWLLPIHQ